jgi:UPF0755 protein
MRGAVRKTIAIIIFAVVIGEVFWWGSLPSGNIDVYIPAGSSAREITTILKNNGLISSKKIFFAVLKLMRRDKKLKSGLYEFSRRDSFFDLIEKLSYGRSISIMVSIPEGFTAQQIATRLEDKKITDGKKFLQIVKDKKLEGFLFPETYQFEASMPAEKVIQLMLQEFDLQVTFELKVKANEIKGMDMNKIVTLASIIEHEAKVPSEKPLIASVFYNRLKKHMPLESCATVQCALGEHKERLSYKDTRIDSPYNTYIHPGLPPGPICNPGLDSIKAAIIPAKTDDLYFVATSSGTHLFSKRFSQHVANKINMKTQKAKSRNNEKQ